MELRDTSHPSFAPEPENQQTEFVNVGLHNWRSLRAEWNKRPDDYKPKARGKPVDTNRLMEELSRDGGNWGDRVPLPEFIKVLNDCWGRWYNLMGKTWDKDYPPRD